MNKVAKEDVPNFPRRACFQALMGRGRGGANRDLVGHTLTVSWGQRCGGNDFGQLLMPFGKDAVVQKCKLTLLMLSVDYSKLWMFHSLQIAYLSILSSLWPLVLTLHFILFFSASPNHLPGLSDLMCFGHRCTLYFCTFVQLHPCTFVHLHICTLYFCIYLYISTNRSHKISGCTEMCNKSVSSLSSCKFLTPMCFGHRCTFVHWHICTCAHLHICIFAHLHICTFVHLYICTFAHL